MQSVEITFFATTDEQVLIEINYWQKERSTMMFSMLSGWIVMVATMSSLARLLVLARLLLLARLLVLAHLPLLARLLESMQAQADDTKQASGIDLDDCKVSGMPDNCRRAFTSRSPY